MLLHPDGRKLVDKRVALSGLGEQQARETEREVELLRKLSHPHVVRCLHTYTSTEEGAGEGEGKGGGTLHILMEYCDGGNVAEAIQEKVEAGGGFEMSLVRHWAAQLCAALAHIHSMRVIHRDVKSANLLLTSSPPSPHPSLKLADFGISRLMSSQTNFASTAVGTPYYLAPELIGGSGYDGRADVVSASSKCTYYDHS